MFVKQDFGSSFGDWGNSDRPVEYMFSSSSEGEDSDGDVFLQPITDVDLPTSKDRLLTSNDSISVTAHRLVTLGSSRKRRKYTHLPNFTITWDLSLYLFIICYISLMYAHMLYILEIMQESVYSSLS